MPNDYLKAPQANINHRQIEPNALAFEFMLMVSRLKRPIEKALFEQRTNLSIDTIGPQLDKAHELQLMKETDSHIKLTPHGFRFLNEFQALFL